MAQGQAAGIWDRHAQLPRSQVPGPSHTAHWPPAHERYSIETHHRDHPYSSHYAPVNTALPHSDSASTPSAAPIAIPIGVPGQAPSPAPLSTSGSTPASAALPGQTTASTPISASSPSAESSRAPMQIDQALREHCKIPLSDCFVAALLEDGSVAMFSGPTNLGQTTIQQFFSSRNFVQTMHRMGRRGSGNVMPDDMEPMPAEMSEDLRSPQEYEENPRPPKRTRRLGPRDFEDPEPDDDMPVTVANTLARRPISIGDSESVWMFYQQRLRSCQQNACKIIAKAWVKAIEPKKQSHHPYTGKEDRAPAWWPKPPLREDKVRHKEPDHLYKRERVYLLAHILRLISAPPEKQLPDVRKSNLKIRRLEEVTLDALSGFFADKDNPTNIRKRPFLAELFSVAKQEERYLRGEIDGDTKVWVMTDDKAIDIRLSEDPDSAILQSNEELTASPTGPPLRMPLQPAPHQNNAMLPPVNASQSSMSAPSSSAAYLEHMSVQQPPHHQHPQQPPPSHHYVDATAMAVHQAATTVPINMPVSVQMPEMVSPVGQPPPHDSARRPSIIYASSTSDFQPQSQTPMYSAGHGHAQSHHAPPQWHTGPPPSQQPPQQTPVYQFTPGSHGSAHQSFHQSQQHHHQPSHQQSLISPSQALPYGSSFEQSHSSSMYRPAHAASPAYGGYSRSTTK
ncbi:hypothetical protein BROUX41_002416 [Berkeleyomyces rouxiae]|uniref:uncharacterized protein n=1 Tax=Berkeleyomyces rouxiae TaxID=2035830 RepID=UPI003B7FB98C